MGKATDPLNRPGEFSSDASLEDTMIEETGPQPMDAYADTAGSAGAPIVDSAAWAAGPPPSDQSADTEADEIETHRAQIEQTRAEMSQTIDAIQDRLSPGHIAQHAKDAVRDATVGKAQNMMNNAAGSAGDLVSNAGDAARNAGTGLWETVRQNPVPAALAGIGIGWLFFSGKKSGGTTTYTGSRNYGYEPHAGTYPGYTDRDYSTGQYPGGYARDPDRYADYTPGFGDDAGSTGMTDRAGAMAGRVQDAAGQYAAQARDSAGQMASSVQDTAGQMASQVQGVAQNMAGSAQSGVQRAQSGFQQMMGSNPLAVAAGAVALGIAVGLSIPETEKENELMGPARDALVDQAQQTVQEKAKQVQSVAQQAVGAARDTAQQAADEQGLTG